MLVICVARVGRYQLCRMMHISISSLMIALPGASPCLAVALNSKLNFGSVKAPGDVKNAGMRWTAHGALRP